MDETIVPIEPRLHFFCDSVCHPHRPTPPILITRVCCPSGGAKLQFCCTVGAVLGVSDRPSVPPCPPSSALRRSAALSTFPWDPSTRRGRATQPSLPTPATGHAEQTLSQRNVVSTGQALTSPPRCVPLCASVCLPSPSVGPKKRPLISPAPHSTEARERERERERERGTPVCHDSTNQTERAEDEEPCHSQLPSSTPVRLWQKEVGRSDGRAGAALELELASRRRHSAARCEAGQRPG